MDSDPIIAGSTFRSYSFFFFSRRRRHTRWTGDWSSDVCSSDLTAVGKGTTQSQATFTNVTGSALVTVNNATVLRNVILYATEEFGLSELAVVKPDGTGRRRLTTDQFGYFMPDISRDGRHIAFAGPGGIYAMNADGTGTTLVVSRGSSIDATPAWSPDGSRIAFRSMVDGPFGSAGRIFVVNVDGTGLRQLSPDVPDPNVVY